MTDEWRVLVPREIDPSGPALLDSFAETTSMSEYESVDAAVADLGAYDAVIVRVADIDADAIADSNLKLIAKHGAGLDNVDIEAASAHGIPVANTPGANARSVGEHAIALLFGVRRNLRTADAHVRSGAWERAQFTGHELTGDTLGLFGFGNIARQTADLAVGMGQDVLSYDPYVPDPDVDGVTGVASPDALFERSDAVSVHVPLTEETRHAVSTDQLRALGPDGVIINTARGPVVDEQAVLDALDAGALGGAGLDVFETEPPGPDHPLYERDEVLLTPHVGGVTAAAMARMSRRAAQNVETVYAGDIPETTVNAEELA